MTDPSGDRAFTLAERLGANQEARRLGHRLVGTEHVLMATLADPVVRWALNGVGCDLRSVQDRVTREGTARRAPDRTARLALTPRAAELVTRAAVDVTDADLDRRLDPRLNSRLLGTIVIALLRDEQAGAAVRILDELGVREHTPRLTAVIEQNAGPSVRPRRE